VRIRDAGFAVLDVQQRTDHTARLGVVDVPEEAFQERLRAALSGGLRPLELSGADGPADGAALVRA
jgi:leucyl/phenylalanyl-tRNA--protein transferase